MQNEKIKVLVVGAGPTGLILAAALSKQGISFRLIEKRSEPSRNSRALGIQAGTLEALESFFDPSLPNQLVLAGMPTYGARVHLSQTKVVSIDLSLIPSRYNYILILPQSETERIFEEKVVSGGGNVERNTELVSLKQNSDGILAEIKRANGKSETVEADFIVGCDGAHSQVRHQLGLDFQGNAYRGDFILADVKLDWAEPYDKAQIIFSSAGVIACFPFDKQQHYRLIYVSQSLADQSKLPISEVEFRSLVDKVTPFPIRLTEFTWLTRFSLHHRIVTRMRSGRGFLAGDAAHIHSPVGGQGMNTGIQDALNLASKLFLFLNHQNDLLADYDRERLPVARQVLRRSDWGLRLGMAGPQSLVGQIRSLVLTRLVGREAVQKKFVREISQVDWARAEISRWKKTSSNQRPAYQS